MDPKGKAPAPTPPYRQDAQKGYLPSVPFPHAGPEPSGQALRSFLKGNSLEKEKLTPLVYLLWGSCKGHSWARETVMQTKATQGPWHAMMQECPQM